MTEIERLKKALSIAFAQIGITKKKDMAKYLGYNAPYFSTVINGNEDLSKQFLDSIEDKLKINLDWIKTGEGEMLLKENTSLSHSKSYPNVKMIPLVGQYAYAGYLSGYGDQEYLESLPTAPFFADHDPKGNYIAFEVRGDSMTDDTLQSILDGDIVYGREIKQELWRSKLHIDKWVFIIVHKTDGILVKKITNHDINNGDITIHSFNPLYEDYKLNLNDIAKLFNVIQISRKYRS